MKSWSVADVGLGDTGVTTVTMHNIGPSSAYVKYYAADRGISPVGASGCTLTANEPDGWYCGEQIPAGATITIQVSYQVTDCAGNGVVAPFMPFDSTPVDPLTANATQPPPLKIDGC